MNNPARLSPQFASLQLALVDRFAERGMGTHGEGVQQLTNFQRRLGLGAPADPPTNATWIDLLRAVDDARGHDGRLTAVMDVRDTQPPGVPEHIDQRWPTVGAFSIEVIGEAARTHFYAEDDDDSSPLHPAKLDTRRHELRSVLGAVRSKHPDLTRVVGGSWLYTSASYASLFPAAHVANAVVRRGRSTFRGMSHWGQFLDHRGELRTNLSEEFRDRVASWTGDDPCRLFPIRTLDVASPIELFDTRW